MQTDKITLSEFLLDLMVLPWITRRFLITDFIVPAPVNQTTPEWGK